jgi:ribose-phosphate pyrophosphokinase
MGSPETFEKTVLASGFAHLDLAEATAQHMGIELANMKRKTFPNGERYARYLDSVRGKRVFIMQTHVTTELGSINDAIQEQLFMIDAALTSSSTERTAICPFLGYSRQDRKTQSREPGSVRVVIDQLANAGANRIVTIDLHSPQSQLIFKGPFDHLTAQPLLRAEAKEIMRDYDPAECSVASPDAGATKLAAMHSQDLGIGLLHLDKIRDRLKAGLFSCLMT